MVGINWTNVTDTTSLLATANTNTGGWFWLNMLLMLWIVLGISFIPFGVYPALLGSSFLALIIGIFLAYMGLVAWTWVLGIIGVLIGIFFWIGYSSSKYS